MADIKYTYIDVVNDTLLGGGKIKPGITALAEKATGLGKNERMFYDGDVELTQSTVKQNPQLDLSHVVVNNFTLRNFQKFAPDQKIMPAEVTKIFNCSGCRAIFADGTDLRIPETPTINCIGAISDLNQLVGKLPAKLTTLIVDDKFIKDETAAIEFLNRISQTHPNLELVGKNDQLRLSRAIVAARGPVNTEARKPNDATIVPLDDAATISDGHPGASRIAEATPDNGNAAKLPALKIAQMLLDKSAEIRTAADRVGKSTAKDIKPYVTRVRSERGDELKLQDEENIKNAVLTELRIDWFTRELIARGLKTDKATENKIRKFVKSHLDETSGLDADIITQLINLYNEESGKKPGAPKEGNAGVPAGEQKPNTPRKILLHSATLKTIRDLGHQDKKRVVRLFEDYLQSQGDSLLSIKSKGTRKGESTFEVSIDGLRFYCMPSSPNAFIFVNIGDKQSGSKNADTITAADRVAKCIDYYQTLVESDSAIIEVNGQTFYNFASPETRELLGIVVEKQDEPDEQKYDAAMADIKKPVDVSKDMVQPMPAGSEFQQVDLNAQPKPQIEKMKFTTFKHPIDTKTGKPVPAIMVDFKTAKDIAEIKLDVTTDVNTLFNKLYNFEYMVPLLNNAPVGLLEWARAQTGTVNAPHGSTVPFVHCVHLIIGAIILNASQDAISQHITDLLTAMNTDKLNHFSEFINTVQKIAFNTDINYDDALQGINASIADAQRKNETQKVNTLRLRRDIVKQMQELHNQEILHHDASIPNFLNDLSNRIAKEQATRSENQRFSTDDVIVAVKEQHGNDFDEGKIREFVETHYHDHNIDVYNSSWTIVGKSAFDNAVSACISEIERLRIMKENAPEKVPYTQITGYVSPEQAIEKIKQLWLFGHISTPSKLRKIVPQLSEFLADYGDERKISDLVIEDPKDGYKFLYERLSEFVEIAKEYQNAYMTREELRTAIRLHCRDRQIDMQTNDYDTIFKTISAENRVKWFKEKSKSFRSKYFDEYLTWFLAEHAKLIQAKEAKGMKIADLKEKVIAELQISSDDFDKIYELFKGTDNDAQWFTTKSGAHRRLKPEFYDLFVKWFTEQLAALAQPEPAVEQPQVVHVEKTKKQKKAPKPRKKQTDNISDDAVYIIGEESNKTESGMTSVIAIEYQAKWWIAQLDRMRIELGKAEAEVQKATQKSDDAEKAAHSARAALEQADKTLKDLKEKTSDVSNWSANDFVNYGTELGNAQTKQEQDKQEYDLAQQALSEASTELAMVTQARDSIKKKFDQANDKMAQLYRSLSEKDMYERLAKNREEEAKKLNEELVQLLGIHGSLGE